MSEKCALAEVVDRRKLECQFSSLGDGSTDC